VSTLDPMVEPAVDRHMIPIVGQRLEQGRGLVSLANRFRKKRFRLKSKEIADCHKPGSANARSTRGSNG